MKLRLRILCCAIAALCMNAATAQNWPAKPVKLVVSTGPGLATDSVARLLSERLSRNLGQAFIVENMAGAGGIIGAQSVARAIPDGYTCLFTGSGTLVTNLYAFKSLPYDPVRDLTPVAMITESGGFVVAVNNDVPATDLSQLIALVKSRPGQFSYAVDSSNIYVVILGKLLNKVAGLDMAEIPYKSTPQALQDTVAGRTQIIISAVAPLESLAKSGKLRRLAVSSPRRNPALPDVPTMAETLPGFRLDGGGFALVAPAGTPAEILQRFNAATVAVLKEPDFQQKMLSLGQITSAIATREAASTYLRLERERWGNIFQDLAIQPQ